MRNANGTPAVPWAFRIRHSPADEGLVVENRKRDPSRTHLIHHLVRHFEQHPRGRRFGPGLHDRLTPIGQAGQLGIERHLAQQRDAHFVGQPLAAASSDFAASSLSQAAIIVIVVIFLFLGNLRSTLIPIVTIPLSLVGVMFALLALGYSINLLTLLALVLAIGLVVDDAIVVVENIHRHIEEGMAPFDAALVGAREIAVPVISMTITLAAVYAPIGFVSGLTGILFREFAFTLAGAVVVSGIIALTLSPMMASKLLKPQQHAGRFGRILDRAFDGLRRRYHRRLNRTLDRRPVTLLTLTAVMLATGMVVAYGYLMETFTAWYSGDVYEQYMMMNRMFGPYGYMYWVLILFNILIPQLLWVRRVHANVPLLFLIAISVNIGMWLERYVIVVVSLHRDYMPSAWGMYSGTIVDYGVLAGSIGLFVCLLFLFIRFLPMISIFEMRELVHDLSEQGQTVRNTE